MEGKLLCLREFAAKNFLYLNKICVKKNIRSEQEVYESVMPVVECDGGMWWLKRGEN